MAQRYHPSYCQIRALVDTNTWDSLKIGFGPFNRADLQREDVEQDIFLEIFGDKLEGRDLYRANQFVDAWNKVAAAHPKLKMAILSRYKNQWDALEDKRAALLPPAFRLEVETFVLSLPAKQQIGLSHAIEDCAVRLIQVKLKQIKDRKPKNPLPDKLQPDLTLKDLVAEENILTILDDFGPADEPSPLRTSTITWLRKLASVKNIHVDFDTMFETYRKKTATVSNDVLHLLTHYYLRANFDAACRKAAAALSPFEGAMWIKNSTLAPAQMGLIWLISVLALADYGDLIRLNFAGPPRQVAAGMERPQLIYGATSEAQWPEPIRCLIDRYWAALTRLLGYPPQVFYLNEKGVQRRSPIGKNIVAAFDFHLAPSQFRLAGFTMALLAGVEPCAIAKTAGIDEDYFSLHYRGLIDAVLRYKHTGKDAA